MHLSFKKADRKLIVTFILFSLTFFVVAMIALFLVIYTSEASELFKITNELYSTGQHGIGGIGEVLEKSFFFKYIFA